MSSKNIGQHNVSYEQLPKLDTFRSAHDGEEGPKFCKSKQLHKNIFPVKTKPVIKPKCSTGLKKLLIYSSEKLKLIGKNMSSKNMKTKLPVQISCFKNNYLEKSEFSKSRVVSFVTSLKYQDCIAPSAARGVCSLKPGLMDGRGEGKKTSNVVIPNFLNNQDRYTDSIMNNREEPMPEMENHLAKVNHDHTYAKNATKILKNALSLKKYASNRNNLSACNKIQKKGVVVNRGKNFEHSLETQSENACKIKFFCLNVGGLKSKLITEDLKEVILEYDIVCFLEIKMDLNDVGVLEADFHQFKILTNLEAEYETHPRGGIAILIKNHLFEEVTLLPKTNQIALSVKINGQILQTVEDVILCAVYVPPVGSLYSNDDDFETLEKMIYELKQTNQKIILAGDFNAKTKNLPDYFILSEHDDFQQLEGIFDEKVIKTERYSQDAHEIDTFGQKLLNFCKISNVQIINGRLGKDAKLGKVTTRNFSVIDYTITTPNLFEELKDFDVLEFNPILSDVHCPLTFSLLTKLKEPKHQKVTQNTPKIRWDGSKNLEFLNNIDDQEVEILNRLLDNFIPSADSNDQEIENFVKITNDILNKAKQKTFVPKKPFSQKFAYKKSWYDRELTTAKKRFNTVRKNKNKNATRIVSKHYKSLLKSKFKNYFEKRDKKLKEMKVNNPRLYWDTIQGKAKGNRTGDLSAGEFGSFFKNLNVQIEADTSEISFSTENKNPFEELNAPFSESELKNALKNLKNNKSNGPDELLNEQIKTSFSKMKGTFLKLFNLILNTGCFPESWAEGLIVPIYKMKGSKNDPNNYRGITLLSCLSKFFNICLNNRLKIISEKILSAIQAGFRPGFSTMDHIFTLLCILTLYERLQKNLFIAFIDYQKAFDTVWRAGLWLKLINEGISGKFLNVVKDMYSKSKSCVLLNNEKSEHFGSYAGVRQGEILSPLLFALYINDLEGFLRNKGVQPLRGLLNISGEVVDFNDNEIIIFLDLLTLFYADDTIIFADSAIGLQFALEELQNYCENWKLTVNEDKTKVMCITKGRYRKENYEFVYNGKKLETVDEFIYLGLCFTKKGLTNKTVTCRETASKKAMFGFLNRCKQNHIPIEVQLDVFKKTVVPCMLYGGEVWGYNNIECLEIIQRKFLKYSLKIKSSTPTAMIYCETGYLSLETELKIKIITYWVNLITGRKDKISYKIYLICLSLYKRGLLLFPWMKNVVEILNSTGFSNIFIEQFEMEEKYLKNIFLRQIKSTIRDQAVQVLLAEINNDEIKFSFYNELISFHGVQKYLKKMPPDIWVPVVKIRTKNHKLPVEIYSWKIAFKPLPERTCTICDMGEVGDEYHFVMNCPVFNEDRNKLLPTIKNDKSLGMFIKLLKSDDIKILRGLAKFLKILFEIFD